MTAEPITDIIKRIQTLAKQCASIFLLARAYSDPGRSTKLLVLFSAIIVFSCMAPHQVPT